MLIADGHNDLLMLVARRPKAVWSSYFRERWIPQLRAGGIDVQVLPVFIDNEFRPEGALRETLRMIEAAHTVAAGNADEVALCTAPGDVEAATAAGKIALVLALEGCPQIDNDLELFHTLQRLGVRMVSFTHFGRSALADGSGEDATGGRLTLAGVEAVGLLEELGVLIDVSHVGRAGVEHILELARKPIVASHSSAFGLRDHHRNLTDEQLRAIAATGGVVCVNFFAGFLSTSDKPTIDDLAAHLEYVVDVAGADHVGFGSDFVAEVWDEKVPACDRPLIIQGVDTSVYIDGLEGPAGMPLVTAALQQRGMPEATLRKVVGANLTALLSTVA